jgi:glycosyltransferase involved in cell wall biosynthesis
VNVVIITNVPTPYRIPLFNEIARQLGGKNVQLHVIFAAATYGRRSWDTDWSGCLFRHTVLDSPVFESPDGERAMFTYRGLPAALGAVKPSVVIASGFSPATVRLWLRSWFGGPPYLIWSGDIRDRSRGRSALRRLQRRVLLSRAAGCIAYGSGAKAYLVTLGAGEDDVAVAINTVDTSFFSKEAESARASAPRDGAARRLITVAHLTKRKRIDLLLDLMKELLHLRGDVVLDVVGDGPERQTLERQAVRLGVSDAVRFAGFRQREEVVSFLACADCFLFPTGFDIWGLVVIEAMAAGLPCFASPEAGVTRDLIDDGVNGFVEGFQDPAAAARRVHSFLEDRGRVKTMGRNARHTIDTRASLEISARGFVRAVARHLQGPGRSDS